MPEITDSALQQFKKLITDSKADGSGIRVFASGGGCCGPSYGMEISETGEAGDKLLEKDGLKIFIDSVASESLDNATIDYLKQGNREGFSIQGLPKSGCCG
jgi:iron-sulfur cluster assembly accessory protein